MKGYGKKILAIMLAASAAVSGIFGIDAVPAYAQENSDTQDTVMPVSYEEYDVAVFGSDPEGVAAAASAAKNGLRTLLVDFEREAAGGLYTLGWLNMIDFNYAPDNEDSVFDTRFYPENYLWLSLQIGQNVQNNHWLHQYKETGSLDWHPVWFLFFLRPFFLFRC